MRKLFNTIDDFIKSKDNCIFCGNKLSAILTNFLSYNKKIPIINSICENDMFSFYFSRTTTSYDVSCSVIVYSKTNYIKFENNGNYNNIMAADAFDQTFPHIELQCPNKKCKYDYYLSGDIFKINKTSSKIEPFCLIMESFNLDSNFIQNDFHTNKTIIYSKNEDSKPLNYPILNFNQDKEKLIAKLNTMITFS